MEKTNRKEVVISSTCGISISICRHSAEAFVQMLNCVFENTNDEIVESLKKLISLKILLNNQLYGKYGPKLPIFLSYENAKEIYKRIERFARKKENLDEINPNILQELKNAIKDCENYD